MAAIAGHDLVIEVESWSATLDLQPSEQGSRLDATIDATSLKVREGNGGVKPLSDSDRADIQANIAKKVLKTDGNPTITFSSTAIRGQDAPVWRVEGQLTIAGTTKPVEIEVAAETSGSEMVLKASVPIVQSSFGIKPYSAMMGALRVADTVEARAEVRVAQVPAG
jgi:polyisoprenoid-binding protein YceI